MGERWLLEKPVTGNQMSEDRIAGLQMNREQKKEELINDELMSDELMNEEPMPGEQMI